MMSSPSPLRPSSGPDDPVGADALATGQFPAAADPYGTDGPHSGTVLPPPPSGKGSAVVPARALEEPDEALRWLDEALAEEMEIDLGDLEDDRQPPARSSSFPPSRADFSDTAIVPKRR